MNDQRKPKPTLTPEQVEAVERFFEEFQEVANGTGRHEGHTLKQVGRCVYCSCGFRYQGRLP
ncbi:MAG TPA: hypothetical protein VF821_13660 [Lentzea sp.]